MNKSAVALVSVLGICVAGSASGTVLSNTNIVGVSDVDVSTLKTPKDASAYNTWTISDTESTSFYITNSVITATAGVSTNLDDVVSAHHYLLGVGGLESMGSAHELTVVDSTVEGSAGGAVSASKSSRLKLWAVDGGNGMLLDDVTATFVNATISGGDGGKLEVDAASSTSSADGGTGILVAGSSTLTAVGTTISGGDGGYVNNLNRTGVADGGAGVEVSGAYTVVLDFDDNTTVTGGDGGVVKQVYRTDASADGADGLYVSGGADVTINGGTFIGGAAGAIDGVDAENAPTAGAAIRVEESDITLAGGTFVGGMLFSSGDSTLALKSTFGDSYLNLSGGTLLVNEWYDGQLADVYVADGTITFDNSGVFNLGGRFVVARDDGGKAKFDGGLVVQDGGVLDLGVSTVTAAGAVTKSGSTVLSMRGTTLGKISSSADLTLESGTAWVITDIETTALNVGDTVVLATAAGSITNGLTGDDVTYLGANGEAGWLGDIVSVAVSGANVEGTYDRLNVDKALGVSGDTSSNVGRAMADLTSLVTLGSVEFNNLAGVTAYRAVGVALATNGFVRTAQASKALAGNQQMYVDVINSRTHSYLHRDRVGYPVASYPEGANGWDLRAFSDRVESGLNTDGLRAFSEGVEGRYGYDQVRDAMNNVEASLSTDGLGLPEDWQVWAQGFGSSAKQDDKAGVAGYEASAGGAMIGVDKRFDNAMFGLAGGFAQTTLDGNENNNAKVDSINAIAYLASHGDNCYIDLNVNYAFSGVDAEFASYEYKGSYDAHTLGAYIGAGCNLALADWLMISPEASLMATYYARDAYSETSSLLLPTKNYDSYDQVIPVATLGATLATLHKVDLSNYEVAMQPEFRVHWMHDFNADMDAETYMFEGGTYDIETPILATEEDLLKIGAGIRLSKWASESTEVSFDVDGLFADGYNAYVVSGKLIHRF